MDSQKLEMRIREQPCTLEIHVIAYVVDFVHVIHCIHRFLKISYVMDSVIHQLCSAFVEHFVYQARSLVPLLVFVLLYGPKHEGFSHERERERDPASGQHLLTQVGKWLDWTGMRAKIPKCYSLAIQASTAKRLFLLSEASQSSSSEAPYPYPAMGMSTDRSWRLS